MWQSRAAATATAGAASSARAAVATQCCCNCYCRSNCVVPLPSSPHRATATTGTGYSRSSWRPCRNTGLQQLVQQGAVGFCLYPCRNRGLLQLALRELLGAEPTPTGRGSCFHEQSQSAIYSSSGNAPWLPNGDARVQCESEVFVLGGRRPAPLSPHRAVATTWVVCTSALVATQGTWEQRRTPLGAEVL